MSRLSLSTVRPVRLDGIPKNVQHLLLDGKPVFLIALADDDLAVDPVDQPPQPKSKPKKAPPPNAPRLPGSKAAAARRAAATPTV